MKKRNISILIGGVLVAGTYFLGPDDEPIQLEIANVQVAVPHRETDQIYTYRSDPETITIGTMTVTRPEIVGEIDSVKCPGCIHRSVGDGLVEVTAPPGKHVVFDATYERIVP